MLGFNAISETAIAQLPGTAVHVTGQALTSTIGATGVVTFLSKETQRVTLTFDSGEISVTGTASISLTGFSTTLSQGNVLVWGKVIPCVTTTYSNVNTSNTPTWTTVTTGASQTWTEEKR